MGDANNTSTLEFFINELLDGLLSDHIDVGCSFIKNNNPIWAKNSPDNTDELTLTHTQVLSFLFDFEVQPFVALVILLLILFLFFFFLISLSFLSCLSALCGRILIGLFLLLSFLLLCLLFFLKLLFWLTF